MAIELKSHNKEIYEKIVEGLKEKNRVAVIKPSGTGNVLIALKWLEENKEKKTVLLVSSYSVIFLYEEYIRSCGYELSDFPNLTMITYSTLLSEVKNGNIREVEGIILDEFHRCRAPEWGRGVDFLLENNKDAKVLGLSTTPIHYLDNNRDILDELFEGNVVFTMDLIEAVARELLPFPFYIIGIYQLDEEIKRYEKKIKDLKNENLEKNLIEKLEIVKRKLSQVTPLDELFFKYMKKKDGKNIIFCKDKKHMKEMIKESHKWFSKVNSKIDIYSVYYGKFSNENELKRFYYSNNDHLKLLFCIDILNEKFPNSDIDGIIMLRPNISSSLFIQQLTRAFALGSTNTIFFDFVNHSESSKDMRNFIEEVKRKQFTEEENIESFKVLEEGKEIFDILNEIECILQTYTSKEYRICLIEEFYRENNRLPKQKEKYKGVLIGMFLQNIKQGLSQITEEQKNRLLELGFVFEIKDKKQEKEEKIQLLEQFYEEKGRLPKSTEEYNGIALGGFLNSIKRGFNKLTEDQKNRLERIGLSKEILEERQIEKYIRQIEQFYKKQNKLPNIEENELGKILLEIKSGKIKITEMQLIKLQSMGFYLEKGVAVLSKNQVLVKK